MAPQVIGGASDYWKSLEAMVGLSTKLSKQITDRHHVSYAELREEFDMEDLDFPVERPWQVQKRIVKSVQK